VAFDLKTEWPIIGAGGLALAGVLALSRGAGTSWTVQNTDTSGAVAVAKAELDGQAAHEQSMSAVLNEVLNYETQGHSIDAQTHIAELQAASANYQAGLGASASEFASSAASDAATSQAWAAVQATKAAQPSWWQSFFAAASQAVAAYFGGVKGGTSTGGAYGGTGGFGR
jgi:hypothetical protein